MPTEQPADAGSEQSIEQRLAALDAPTDTAPEDDTEAAPVAQAEDDSADEQPDELAPEPEDDGFVEVEYDGVKFKAPQQAKDAFMREQDYTRKTQEVAKLQEAAQDRLHFAEAREQLVGAILQDVAEFRALQTQRAQYDNVDWTALYNSDPGQALKLRDQRDQLDRQLQSYQAQISAKAQAHQSAASQHADKQWLLAVEAAKARIGKFSADEDAAMLKIAKDLGFSEKEIKSKLADPRILHAFHKAAKWEMLQQQKPGAVKAVAKAPPVLKPGASQGQRAATESKYKDVRQSLKKSGSIDDAAKLFMLRGN